MKCPRCEKEFPFEYPSFYEWLRISSLDDVQLAYLLLNYGGPLCAACEENLRAAFYHCGVNPVVKLQECKL